MLKETNKIIGIDLGTTNSCVSVSINGSPVIVENFEGKNTTPSFVYVSKDASKQKFIVGDAAKRTAATNPGRTFYDVKRYIGQDWSDTSLQQQLKIQTPFKVIKDGEGVILSTDDGERFKPEQISGELLRKIKEFVEAKLGEKVKKAVITVPAYFNDSQRKATMIAGELAGLEVVRIINEPTAAALCYLNSTKKNGKIVVFDLGGGTFDVSILERDDSIVQTLSTNGDNHLGGSDFDNRIVDYIADAFKKEHGIDLRSNAVSLQRLRDAAESAKITLSASTETVISLPYIHNSLSAEYKLTRTAFERLIDDLLERVKQPCLTALKDANLKTQDIDAVILVGGSTRIPKCRDIVKEIFGKEPLNSVNPDEAVAVGAAIQGSILAKEGNHDILLVDITPLSLGIETAGGVFHRLINKGTTIPTKKSQTYTTAADNQESVSIVIYQGERDIASKNKKLGQFELNEIPPAPRGVPQIEVTFDIDVNGVVNVTAKDQKTGKSSNITIQNSTALTEEEIEKMKKEAEEHAESDKQIRELIEAKNQAESLIYTAENTLKKQESLSDAVRKEIEEKKHQLQETLNKEPTLETLKEQTDQLSEALQKSYEDLAKNANGSTGNANEGDSTKASDTENEPQEPS